MRVPQKVDYALRALLHLALEAGDAPVRSATIARRAGVPDKYLEAILVELGRAGLVTSRRGPDGGHRLVRSPAEIRVADVYAAVDGPLQLAPERSRRAPVPELDRTLEGLWRELQGAVAGVLGGLTLEDLRRRGQAVRSVVDFNI
jgi:Rrf2 family protein